MVPCVEAIRVTAVEEYELNGHTYGVPRSLPFHCPPCLYKKDVARRKGSSGCRDGSGGIQPVHSSTASNSLILCHSEDITCLSHDLPLKSKRLIVVTEKSSGEPCGGGIWGELGGQGGGLLRVSGCKMME